LWIFQKGFLEGAETCWKGLYVCVFAPLCQYEERIRTIVKLVHLVGFITNKFVTMHGHMNVKSSKFFVDTFLPVFFPLLVVRMCQVKGTH
jgi:hypothetical protein